MAWRQQHLRMGFSLLRTVLLAMLVAQPASAEKAVPKPTLVIATEIDDGYYTKGGTGLWPDLVDAILGDQYQVRYQETHLARATKLLNKNVVDAVLNNSLPLVKAMMAEGDYVYPKWPLATFPFYAFSTSGRFLEWHDQHLKIHRILWQEGYRMQLHIPHKMNGRGVTSYDQAFRLLKMGRADILLDYDLDLDDFDHSDGIVGYVTKHSEDVHIVFKNTPENRELVQRWDRRFRELLKSDTIHKIFDRHGVPFFPRITPTMFTDRENAVSGETALQQIPGFYELGDKTILFNRKKGGLFAATYRYSYLGEKLSGLFTATRYDSKLGKLWGRWCEGAGVEGSGEMVFYFSSDDSGALRLDSIYTYKKNPEAWHFWANFKKSDLPAPRDYQVKTRERLSKRCLEIESDPGSDSISRQR